MWAVKLLSGPQAGEVIPLQAGNHTVGRGPTCQVKINSNSVSKEHCSILVTGDKLIVTDLNSRNGTFVNGVRIQNQRLNLNDKVSLHDIIFEIIRAPAGMDYHRNMGGPGGTFAPPPPSWAGNAAVAYNPQQYQNPNYGAHAGQPHLSSVAQDDAGQMPQMQVSANSISGLFYNFKIYTDNVAMPGVYKVAQSIPYRYALLAMVAVYILVVTALSTVPVVSTTKTNIQMESMRRAKTIARNMAAVNRMAIIENNSVHISVKAAELEEGVTSALIISAKDGTIIAPASKRDQFVNKPFVNKARREEKETAEFIDDSNLGVAVPITVYAAESGSQNTIAYSIVLYDMGALAMSTKQTFGLFVQVLAIALLAGSLLYFFMMKVIEHPVESINLQLDDALREGRDDLRTEYQFPALERLASNINSALSRIGQNDGSNDMAFTADRDSEAANVVRMLPAAAVAVNALDERVIATNQRFDQLVGGGVNLQARPLTDIPDIALQQNLLDLIPNMRASVSQIALGEIPFGGEKYEINGQAVMGAQEPAYFLIVITKMDFS